jgi:hypothetical protein
MASKVPELDPAFASFTAAWGITVLPILAFYGRSVHGVSHIAIIPPYVPTYSVPVGPIAGPGT